MSEDNQKNSNNNKKRYNKNKKRSSYNNAAPKNAHSPKGNANHKRKKRYNNNKKPLTPEKIHAKYDNLLEQHLVARRKFFEVNGRGNSKQTEKARAHFYRSIEQLRNFEAKLKDWQKEVLEKKTELYQPDLDFSMTHNLPEHDQDHALAILADNDPHILDSQKIDFSHDTEESIGTMEDYERYKAAN